MQNWFKKGARWALYFCVSILILLSVGLVIARSGWSYWLAKPEVKAWIQDSIQTQLHAQLEIDELSGLWEGNRPQIHLENLSFQGPQYGVNHLKVQSIQLSLNLTQSLLWRRPFFDTFLIDGVTLALQPPEGVRPPSRFTAKHIKDWLPIIGHGRIQGRLGARDMPQNGAFWALFDSSQGMLELNITDPQGGQFNAQARLKKAVTDWEEIDGHIYIAAKEYDAFALKRLLSQHQLWETRLNMESWLTLEQGSIVDGLAQLASSSLRWANQEMLNLSQGQWQYDDHALKGRVLLSSQDQSSSQDLSSSQERSNWIQTNLSVDHGVVSFNIPVLPLHHFNPLFAVAAEQQAPRLAVDLQDIFGRWDNEGWTLQAWWQDGALQRPAKGPDWLPNLDQTHGRLAITPEYSILDLALDGELELGQLFKAPIPLEGSSLRLKLQPQNDRFEIRSDDLDLRSGVVHAKGQFSVLVGGEQPAELRLYSEVESDDLSQTWRYLPWFKESRQAMSYLSSAIQGGRLKGQVLWDGALRDFPYDQHNGMFQAQARVSDATYQFQPDWKPLTDLQLSLFFNNDSLLMNEGQAQLMSTKGQQIVAEFERLDGSPLKVTAKVKSQGSQPIRDYLIHSPVGSTIVPTLDLLAVEGPVNGEIKLNIPLDKREQVDIQGQVDLKGNQIRLLSDEEHFTDAVGRVQFHNDHVSVPRLNAKYKGQSVSLSADTDPKAEAGYQVNIQTNANWPVEFVANWIELPWDHAWSGQIGLDGQAQLTINDSWSYQANIDADLAEMASYLPAPFSKDFGQPLIARMMLNGQPEAHEFRAKVPNIGEYLQRFSIDENSGIQVIGRGASIGHIAPAAQINHWVADLQTLDSSVWEPWITPLDLKTAEHREGEAFPTQHLDIQASNVRLGERIALKTASISGQIQPAEAALAFSSDLIRGEVVLRDHEPTQLNLDYLRLPALEAMLSSNDDTQSFTLSDELLTDSELAQQHFQRVPAIDGMINDLRLGQQSIGRASFKLRRWKDRVQLTEVTLKQGKNS